MTPQKRDTPLAFDPWPSATARPIANPPRPWQSPASWGALPPALREVFGGAALEILAENPTATKHDVGGLAHRVWDRARGRSYTFAGRTVRVEHGVREVLELAAPVLMLEDLLRRLLDAGDLVATLRAERDRLDTQLAALEQLRGAEVAR